MYPKHQNQNQNQISYEQLFLLNGMRFVWEQHVYWTRMLLISIAERLKDENDTTERLLRNPRDIADIYAEYYGKETADAIAGLLTEHLMIGKSLITALRDKNTADAETLTKRWYINADKMADALASINPNYDRGELRDMLHTHLDLTAQEVAMRLAGDYKADIDAFDKVEKEAISMADYLAVGIINQFPDKF
jgi:hypothetical protein